MIIFCREIGTPPTKTTYLKRSENPLVDLTFRKFNPSSEIYMAISKASTSSVYGAKYNTGSTRVNKIPANNYFIVSIKSDNESKDVGICSIYNVSEDEISFSFFVLPFYTGIGIGFAIASHLVDYFRELGYSHCSVYIATKNTASLKVFEKLNFTLFNESYSRNLHGVELRLKL